MRIFRKLSFFVTLTIAFQIDIVFGAMSPEIIKDFGLLPPDAKSVEFNLTWTNPYNIKLDIEAIAKSCGCSEIKPKEGIIEPGQTITFTADVDVSNFYGYGTVKFTVLFKNASDKRTTFVANFFRTISLTPSPSYLDFGFVDFPIEARYTFKVGWVIEPNETGVEVLPNVFSENSIASCHLIGEKKKTIRNANAEKDSVKQEFTFEAFLKPDIKNGDFSDTIKIPTRLNNHITYILVPVKGFFYGKMYASPSYLFSTILDKQNWRDELKTTLFLQSWCSEPNNLSISCDDPNISVSIIKNKQLESDNKSPITYAFIEVRLVEPELCQKTISTILKVDYTIDSVKSDLEIPLKIVIPNNKLE